MVFVLASSGIALALWLVADIATHEGIKPGFWTALGMLRAPHPQPKQHNPRITRRSSIARVLP